jgi:hypothetical protein
MTSKAKQPQKTHGKTTNQTNNKDKQPTNNTKLLNTKADVLAKLDYDRSRSN